MSTEYIEARLSPAGHAYRPTEWHDIDCDAFPGGIDEAEAEEAEGKWYVDLTPYDSDGAAVFGTPDELEAFARALLRNVELIRQDSAATDFERPEED